MATTTKTNNEQTDPQTSQTSQAELAYRIVSTLIGRRSATRLSPADVRHKRGANSLALTEFDAAGIEVPLKEGTSVTMYIERGGSWPAEISIVAGTVDKEGIVALQRKDHDRVIASLIVESTSGTVDLGRIQPPEKGRAGDDGGNGLTPGKPPPGKKAAAKPRAKAASKTPPAKKAAAKSPAKAARTPRKTSTTQEKGG